MGLSYLFPSSLARVASRAGRVALFLAVSVAFLFPVSAGAGTDTDSARWTTAAALAVSGILLVLGRGRWSAAAAAFAALAAGAIAAPAAWLLGFGAIASLYVATALVPRGAASSPSAAPEAAVPPVAKDATVATAAPVAADAPVATDATVAADAPVATDATVATVTTAAVGVGMVPAAAAPVPAAESPDLAPEDLPRHEGREIIDSVAIALVLALVVREFAFEAFKIPTGSMEPTILGDQGMRSGEPLLSEIPRALTFKDPVHGRRGDRLLAFKGSFSDPSRWQIVVFKFPLFRTTNYIKRLIGLPGDHLELRAGDVYVDGAIVAKPDSVQEVMWQDARGWKDSPVDTFDPDPAGGWSLGAASASLDAPPAGGSSASDGPGTGSGVRWIVARSHFHADLRASFDVEDLQVDANGASGAFLVRVEGGRRRVTLEITREAMRVTAPGRDAVDLRIGGAADLPAKFRLGLACSDRIVRVFLDGRQVARMETADAANTSGDDHGRFSVGGVAASARLRRFTVEEDVQYSKPYDGIEDFGVLPDDGFVMLGDNTESSRDSRVWTANVIRLKDGRTLIAPSRARLDDEREVTTYHRREDGGVDCIDSDGIPRNLSKDEIESVESGVAQPFVRRRDIVGPAFLDFFPFPPFGDFRPRFLR